MPRTVRALHRGNDVRRPHARSRPPDHRRSARRSRRHGPLAVASVRPTDRKRSAGRCCQGVVRSPHLGRSHCQLRVTTPSSRMPAFQKWIDQLEVSVTTILIPALEQCGMMMKEESYKAAGYEPETTIIANARFQFLDSKFPTTSSTDI